MGGSVITNKKTLKTVRPSLISRLAKELTAAEEKMILVHGAGSFGHIRAKKYKLQEGFRGESQLRGFAEVQEDVRSLNLYVMNALRRRGFCPVSIPPGIVVRFKGGELELIETKPFRDYLALGMVPVTFGDVVLDAEWRFAICSGDDLMLELSKAFRPSKCLFVTDVNGISSSDPKGKGKSELLTQVSPRDLGKMDLAVERRFDVTGGIEGKLRKMSKAARYAEECWILNGLAPGRLRDALQGKKFIGTRVVS